MWWFEKKKKESEEERISVWKEDFSKCMTADYLPNYSVCQTEDTSSCRYIAQYEGMVLCSHPEHKSFIPEGSEPFNPHANRFSN